MSATPTSDEAYQVISASRGRLRALLPRQALDHFGQARAAVTISFGGAMIGTAARTVATISVDPPRILVVIEAHERLVSALAEVGSFALNLIDEDSFGLARRFDADSETSLDGMTVVRGASGHPLLGDSVAQLECVVHESGSIGELRAYLADITDARARAGASLDSIGGHLRSFVASRDDATYQEIRNAIMDRRFPVDREVVVADLIEQLGVERANVIYGLTRLIHEGLVTRRDAERYTLTPVDEGLIVTLLHARRILMIGITSNLISELTDTEIASVVEAAEATRRPPGTVDIGMENDRSVRVFQDFNELVVGLSGNSVLLDTYRRLSVPTVMGRVLWRLDWSTLHDELSEHALAFASGIATRDRDQAILAVNSFNECVRHYAVGILRRTGGRL